jgi:hydrogenase nickel incorporation protein HypA/HybF
VLAHIIFTPSVYLKTLEAGQMHEQSIAESLLILALEKAENAKAKKILKIHVVAGELTGVLEETVNSYFSLISRNTIAAEASLVFIHSPVRLRCRNCNAIFLPQKLSFCCPNCGEQQTEIISGRELYVDNMEIE